MKLEGSLDAFSLPDVFQLLESDEEVRGTSPGRWRRSPASSTSPEARSPVPSLTPPASRWPVAWSASEPATTRRCDARSSVPPLRVVGVARALAEAGAVDAELLHAARPGADDRRGVRPAALVGRGLPFGVDEPNRGRGRAGWSRPSRSSPRQRLAGRPGTRSRRSSLRPDVVLDDAGDRARRTSHHS